MEPGRAGFLDARQRRGGHFPARHPEHHRWSRSSWVCCRCIDLPRLHQPGGRHKTKAYNGNSITGKARERRGNHYSFDAALAQQGKWAFILLVAGSASGLPGPARERFPAGPAGPGADVFRSRGGKLAARNGRRNMPGRPGSQAWHEIQPDRGNRLGLGPDEGPGDAACPERRSTRTAN